MAIGVAVLRLLMGLWQLLMACLLLQHVHVRDEDWRTNDIVAALCNRRRDERTVAYVECHDQCIVGDQTLGESAVPVPRVDAAE